MLILAMVTAGLTVLGATPASAGDGSGQLSLPWAADESWTLWPSDTGKGFHSWDGALAPSSSFDFAGTGKVRAAAGGIVHRDSASCPGEGYIRIDHLNGWQTTYHHLRNMPATLTEGSSINRGDELGDTGTNTPCGGHADGNHVHFTVWKPVGAFSFASPAKINNQASLIGLDIGGWNIDWDSPSHTKACLTRISDNVKKCMNEAIPSNGAIGSGTVPGSPYGSYDLLSRVPEGVRIGGWAADPNTTDPINVHVYADGAVPGSGSPVGGVLASNYRADVGYHAFDGSFTYGTNGAHNMCAWAVNVGPGAPTNLGCRSLTFSRGAAGSFDVAQQTPGKVRVAGWAFDWDTAASVNLHVIIDGTVAGTITANNTRTDIGATYPGYGDNHGYDGTVNYTTAGSHNVCVWALNDGTAGDTGSTQLGCKTVVINNDPVGSFDVIGRGPGGIRLAGWGLDRSLDGAASIHVYVDGNWVGALSANNTRTDIGAAYPGYGDNHGFDGAVPWTASGNHQACAWVVGDSLGAGNAGLGCKNITISNVPFGSFDAVSSVSGGVNVVGWAIDPDTGGADVLNVFVDSGYVGQITADTTRADVGAAFPLYGDNHGFNSNVTYAPRGNHNVCVYATNMGAGAAGNYQLSCKSVNLT